MIKMEDDRQVSDGFDELALIKDPYTQISIFIAKAQKVFIVAVDIHEKFFVQAAVAADHRVRGLYALLLQQSSEQTITDNECFLCVMRVSCQEIHQELNRERIDDGSGPEELFGQLLPYLNALSGKNGIRIAALKVCLDTILVHCAVTVSEDQVIATRLSDGLIYDLLFSAAFMFLSYMEYGENLFESLLHFQHGINRF
jgi:PIN domain nuclease of toxin-antitoxin system